MISITRLTDLATVIQNWQQDLLYTLETKQKKTSSSELYDSYQDSIDMLKDLPFTTEFYINEDVMCKE